MAERVAVLGTGIMGAPMARNLLKAGFQVRVWNRTPRQGARADGRGRAPALPQKRAVLAIGGCSVRDVSGSRTRVLRRVEPDDIAVFFEQQADPAAAAMAAFPARDRVAHDEHWARILGDSSAVARAIVLPDGQIVGNIGSFDVEGERHVGYWIGREHWGQGHASRALTEFVAEFPERPLYARVAEHNTASMRVLAKCGFVVVGEAQEAGDPVKDIVLRLS